MKKTAAVILVLYNTLFVSFMVISGLLSSGSNAALGVQLLLLPVLLYLVFSIKKTLKSGESEIALGDKKYLGAIGAIFIILLFIGIRSVSDKPVAEDTPIIFNTSQND